MSPRVFSAPGKLMIAGEYAALRPGGVALALAVARRLRVTLTPAPSLRVTSALLGLDAAPWPTGDPFIDAALVACPPAHIEISSSLSTPGAPKGGLGSSAALVVALVGAAHARRGEAVDPLQVLEGALAAHLKAQGFRGSGYDVLTCALGGLVASPCPDPPRADRARRGEGPLAQGAARLPWPIGVYVGRVQSDQAADTRALIQRAKGADPTPLAAASAALLDGLTLARIDAAQRAFEAWDAAHRLGLMTPDLQALCASARAAGLVPRVSGAGGGDSLLLFSHDEGALAALLDHYRARGRAAERLTPAPGFLEEPV
ncbi:hypothetical protein KKB55_18880 [Myxococcota bacterium]|nr:hypothetical protein [Myxococcota bacterium]MBU1899812.1 hypothetical protein [Myxococcota bacterium]